MCSHQPTIPAVYARRISSGFGSLGQSWLDSLPELVQGFADEHGLQIGHPLGLSYSYVCEVTDSAGQRFVLKAFLPDEESIPSIAAASHLNGILRPILHDEQRLILTFSMLEPATTLAEPEMSDEEAFAILGQKMLQCKTLLPSKVPHYLLDRFLATLDRASMLTELPLKARSIAREGFLALDELLSMPGEQYLLHGDLHHENILLSGTEWITIDPKGYSGSFASEVAASLHNPYWATADIARNPSRTRQRLKILADILEEDFELIKAWGFALNVLSTFWFWEEGNDDLADFDLPLAISRA